MRRQRDQTAVSVGDGPVDPLTVPRDGDDGVGGFGPPQTGNTGEPGTPGPFVGPNLQNISAGPVMVILPVGEDFDSDVPPVDPSA